MRSTGAERTANLVMARITGAEVGHGATARRSVQLPEVVRERRNGEAKEPFYCLGTLRLFREIDRVSFQFPTDRVRLTGEGP